MEMFQLSNSWVPWKLIALMLTIHNLVESSDFIQVPNNRWPNPDKLVNPNGDVNSLDKNATYLVAKIPDSGILTVVDMLLLINPDRTPNRVRNARFFVHILEEVKLEKSRKKRSGKEKMQLVTKHSFFVKFSNIIDMIDTPKDGKAGFEYVRIQKELQTVNGSENLCCVVNKGDWLALSIPHSSSPLIQVPYKNSTDSPQRLSWAGPVDVRTVNNTGSQIEQINYIFHQSPPSMDIPITAFIYQEDTITVDVYVECPDDLPRKHNPDSGGMITLEEIMQDRESRTRPDRTSQPMDPTSNTAMYISTGVIATVAVIAIITSSVACLRLKKNRENPSQVTRTDSTTPIYNDIENLTNRLTKNSMYGRPGISGVDNVSCIVVRPGNEDSGAYEEIRDVIQRCTEGAPVPPERTSSTQSSSKPHIYLVVLPDRGSDADNLDDSETCSSSISSATSVAPLSKPKGARTLSNPETTTGKSAHVILKREESAPKSLHKLINRQESGPYWRIED